MIWQMYSIFDVKTEVYQGPFRFQTEGQALRWFQDAIVSAESELSKHPEDYNLFFVGSWNDSKGEFIEGIKKCVSTGLEMVARSQAVSRENLQMFDDQVSIDGGHLDA
jgi:hypothetical protein